MTVGAIVCRGGVGPKATIGLFVTHGLLPGAAPAPTPKDTHDGFPKKKHAATDHSRLNKILAEREQRKLQAQNDLRKQLDRLFGRAEEEALENNAAPETTARTVQKRTDKIRATEQKLLALEQEIQLIQQEIRLNDEMMRLAAIESRRMKDEQDIQVILALLNIDLQQKPTVH